MKGTNNYKIIIHSPLHRDNPGNLGNTVAHELSHVIQMIHYPHSRSHGKEFKIIMNNLGYAPSTTHNMDVTSYRKPSKRYEYKCKCKTHYITPQMHGKILKGSIYRCRKYQSVIEFTGNIHKY